MHLGGETAAPLVCGPSSPRGHNSGHRRSVHAFSEHGPEVVGVWGSGQIARGKATPQHLFLFQRCARKGLELPGPPCSSHRVLLRIDALAHRHDIQVSRGKNEIGAAPGLYVKNGAPQVQVRRLPMQTPSNAGFLLAKDGVRGAFWSASRAPCHTAGSAFSRACSRKSCMDLCASLR